MVFGYVSLQQWGGGTNIDNKSGRDSRTWNQTHLIYDEGATERQWGKVVFSLKDCWVNWSAM